MRVAPLFAAALALVIGLAAADEPVNPNIEGSAKEEKEEELDGAEIMADGKTRKEHVAQYLYCKEFNCYDVLGVKRTSGQIAIKRSYRKAAAEWHPDKNTHPDAKDIFQKYSTAYEVLSSSEMRKNYNYLLDHPYEFPMHYMRFGGGGQYAAKTDMPTVVVLIILAISGIQYYFMGYRRKFVLESVKGKRGYQERIKVLMAADVPATTVVAKPKTGGDRGEANSSKTKKASSKKEEGVAERKARAEAKFEEEIQDDLPALPTFADTFAVTIFTSPLTVSRGLFATLRWTILFRVLGQEFGTAEKELLSQQAIGVSHREWQRMSDEERAEAMAEELWVPENNAKFVQDSSGQASAGGRTAKEKRALRQKKKGITAVPMDD